jgi:hypothetical protein
MIILINRFPRLKLRLGMPDVFAKEVVLTCRSKR